MSVDALYANGAHPVLVVQIETMVIGDRPDYGTVELVYFSNQACLITPPDLGSPTSPQVRLDGDLTVGARLNGLAGEAPSSLGTITIAANAINGVDLMSFLTTYSVVGRPLTVRIVPRDGGWADGETVLNGTVAAARMAGDRLLITPESAADGLDELVISDSVGGAPKPGIIGRAWHMRPVRVSTSGAIERYMVDAREARAGQLLDVTGVYSNGAELTKHTSDGVDPPEGHWNYADASKKNEIQVRQSVGTLVTASATAPATEQLYQTFDDVFDLAGLTASVDVNYLFETPDREGKKGGSFGEIYRVKPGFLVGSEETVRDLLTRITEALGTYWTVLPNGVIRHGTVASLADAVSALGEGDYIDETFFEGDLPIPPYSYRIRVEPTEPFSSAEIAGSLADSERRYLEAGYVYFQTNPGYDPALAILARYPASPTADVELPLDDDSADYTPLLLSWRSLALFTRLYRRVGFEVWRKGFDLNIGDRVTVDIPSIGLTTTSAEPLVGTVVAVSRDYLAGVVRLEVLL